MPEGSSSAAPVVSPGPKSSQYCPASLSGTFAEVKVLDILPEVCQLFSGASSVGFAGFCKFSFGKLFWFQIISSRPYFNIFRGFNHRLNIEITEGRSSYKLTAVLALNKDYIARQKQTPGFVWPGESCLNFLKLFNDR